MALEFLQKIAITLVDCVVVFVKSTYCTVVINASVLYSIFLIVTSAFLLTATAYTYWVIQRIFPQANYVQNELKTINLTTAKSLSGPNQSLHGSAN